MGKKKKNSKILSEQFTGIAASLVWLKVQQSAGLSWYCAIEYSDTPRFKYCKENLNQYGVECFSTCGFLAKMTKIFFEETVVKN